MAKLSPAAAILAAFRERYDETLRPGPFTGRWQAPCLAAALEALADEVVPEMEEPDWGACNDTHCDIELYTDHQRKRSAILAIVAELRGGTNG